MKGTDNIYLLILRESFSSYIDYVDNLIKEVNSKIPADLGRVKYLEYVVDNLNRDPFLVKHSISIIEDGNHLILTPISKDNTKIEIKFEKDREKIHELNFYSVFIHKSYNDFSVLYAFCNIFNHVIIEDFNFNYNIRVMEFELNHPTYYTYYDNLAKNFILPLIDKPTKFSGTVLVDKLDSLYPEQLFLIENKNNLHNLIFNKEFFTEEQKDYFTLFHDINLSKYSNLVLNLHKMQLTLNNKKIKSKLTK